MSNAQVTFDSKEFDAMRSNLTGQEMKRAIRRTLRVSATILKKETEKRFLSKINIRRNKMSYRTGRNKVTLRKQLVKIVSDKQDKLAVKVHIMGNFKAKFFEKGTRGRRTRGHRITGSYYKGARKYLKRSGKPAWRGSNRAGHYFRNAQEAKKRDIFEEMDQRLGNEIVKLANKKK